MDHTITNLKMHFKIVLCFTCVNMICTGEVTVEEKYALLVQSSLLVSYLMLHTGDFHDIIFS